jgi:hypothetical protein
MSERERILRQLTDSGEIHSYYKAGIISPSMIKYRDIYYDVMTLETIGNTRMVAIQEVADRYKISIKSVYVAINWMKG